MTSHYLEKRKCSKPADSSTSKFDNTLEILKKTLPIAYVIVVIWGLMYEYIYYQIFGISIANYLDISEVLLLMYDEVLDVIFYLFMGGFYFYIIYSFFNFLGSLNRKINRKKVDLIVYFGTTAALIPTGLLVAKIVGFEAACGLAIGIFSSLFLWLGTPHGRLVLVMLGFLTLFFIGYPLYSSRNIIEEEASRHKIILAQSVQLPDLDSLILLGETKNYIFLYNKKDSTTTAIGRTKVISITSKPH